VFQRCGGAIVIVARKTSCGGSVWAGGMVAGLVGCLGVRDTWQRGQPESFFNGFPIPGRPVWGGCIASNISPTHFATRKPRNFATKKPRYLCFPVALYFRIFEIFFWYILL